MPKLKTDGRSEKRFEVAISYLLMAGVVTSLVLEIVGIALFRRFFGGFAISEEKIMFLHGKNFFDFMASLFRGETEGTWGLFLMTLGVVILVLTPYARVVMSVLYFAWVKNIKYVLITLFVLVVLSLSLAVH